ATPEQPRQPKDLSSPEALIQMITGFWISQAIYAAAKLGIANLVKEGSKPCEELAQATGMHPQALYRLLRALASVGVFRAGADGRFGLTPLAAYLQTGVPDSLRALALMQSEVESQGRLLGVGSLDGHEIKRVYVLPGTQGQGVGRALMRALEAEGQWRGL